MGKHPGDAPAGLGIEQRHHGTGEDGAVTAQILHPVGIRHRQGEQPRHIAECRAKLRQQPVGVCRQRAALAQGKTLLHRLDAGIDTRDAGINTGDAGIDTPDRFAQCCGLRRQPGGGSLAAPRRRVAAFGERCQPGVQRRMQRLCQHGPGALGKLAFQRGHAGIDHAGKCCLQPRGRALRLLGQPGQHGIQARRRRARCRSGAGLDLGQCRACGGKLRRQRLGQPGEALALCRELRASVGQPGAGLGQPFGAVLAGGAQGGGLCRGSAGLCRQRRHALPGACQMFAELGHHAGQPALQRLGFVAQRGDGALRAADRILQGRQHIAHPRQLGAHGLACRLAARLQPAEPLLDGGNLHLDAGEHGIPGAVPGSAQAAEPGFRRAKIRLQRRDMRRQPLAQRIAGRAMRREMALHLAGGRRQQFDALGEQPGIVIPHQRQQLAGVGHIGVERFKLAHHGHCHMVDGAGGALQHAVHGGIQRIGALGQRLGVAAGGLLDAGEQRCHRSDGLVRIGSGLGVAGLHLAEHGLHGAQLHRSVIPQPAQAAADAADAGLQRGQRAGQAFRRRARLGAGCREAGGCLGEGGGALAKARGSVSGLCRQRLGLRGAGGEAGVHGIKLGLQRGECGAGGGQALVHFGKVRHPAGAGQQRQHQQAQRQRRQDGGGQPGNLGQGRGRRQGQQRGGGSSGQPQAAGRQHGEQRPAAFEADRQAERFHPCYVPCSAPAA